MPTLTDRLLHHVRSAGLFERPGLALLAVSGGEDSVALLELFVAVGRDIGINLAVAHIDHGIAAGSGQVAGQVMALAAHHGIRGDVRALDLGAGASETRARQERYRALRDLQGQLTADYLVTAHHADDQIETVLFRFLRGSAPAGLAGISAAGPGGLVRPLLPFHRRELHDWLVGRYPDPASRPAVFHDPANRDPRHDRSWLRQNLLPQVRERFGDRLDTNLLTGQGHAARDREAWAALIRQLPELDFRPTEWGADVARLPLRKYDKVLCEALLRAVAREVGCPLGPARASKLVALCRAGASGRTQELGEGWSAELVFDRLRIERRAPPDSPGSVSWGIRDAGSVEWGVWEISWRAEPAGVSTRQGLTTWVSGGPGEIRAAQGGDRVFPLGGVGRRSVHRLLMEARVPRIERTVYPVIVRGTELLWIPGVCRAAGAVPVPGESALRVDVRHA